MAYLLVDFSTQLSEYYDDSRVIHYTKGNYPQFFAVDRTKAKPECECCGAPRSDPMQRTDDCFYCGSHLTPG